MNATIMTIFCIRLTIAIIIGSIIALIFYRLTSRLWEAMGKKKIRVTPVWVIGFRNTPIRFVLVICIHVVFAVILPVLGFIALRDLIFK